MAPLPGATDTNWRLISLKYTCGYERDTLAAPRGQRAQSEILNMEAVA